MITKDDYQRIGKELKDIHDFSIWLAVEMYKTPPTPSRVDEAARDFERACCVTRTAVYQWALLECKDVPSTEVHRWFFP